MNKHNFEKLNKNTNHILQETKKRIIVQHKQEQKYLENALRTAQHIEDSMKRKEKAKKANKMLHLFR